MRWSDVGGSELQAASSLSPMVEMGQKGALTVKVASMVSYGFTSNFGRGRILVIVDIE